MAASGDFEAFRAEQPFDVVLDPNDLSLQFVAALAGLVEFVSLIHPVTHRNRGKAHAHAERDRGKASPHNAARTGRTRSVSHNESGSAGQRGAARENRRFAQLFFNPQQLVVLRNPVRAGGCAGFDLAAVRGHRKVGNGGVFGLARAM